MIQPAVGGLVVAHKAILFQPLPPLPSVALEVVSAALRPASAAQAPGKAACSSVTSAKSGQTGARIHSSFIN